MDQYPDYTSRLVEGFQKWQNSELVFRIYPEVYVSKLIFRILRLNKSIFKSVFQILNLDCPFLSQYSEYSQLLINQSLINQKAW